MKNLTDDELLRYLDGLGTVAERENVKDELSENPGAKKRMDELQAVHFFLQKLNRVEQPAKNFTEKVMAGLHVKPSFGFLSPKNGLLLLLGLMVASGFAITLVSSNALDQWHTLFNIGQVPLKNNWVKLPSSIPFDLKMTLKIFVMASIVLGFVLLDRTILRPIFQKRSARWV
ncbi:MAG TPA: hypothetical protein VKQ08_00575 [Cyclobacteriaceae bacterium]|nr:hypothetical protein [Cyclobacteriaceae bacterium]